DEHHQAHPQLGPGQGFRSLHVRYPPPLGAAHDRNSRRYSSVETCSSDGDPSKWTRPSRSIRNSVPWSRSRSSATLVTTWSPSRRIDVRATLNASRSWWVTRIELTPSRSRTFTI